MATDSHAVPLDLYRCGMRFQKKIARKRFGMPLVKVAKSVASYRMDEKEERTLMKCLITLINQVEYSQSIGFIPLPFSWTSVNHFHSDDDEVEYVARSLVATAKLYEQQLGDLDTQYVVAQGLEWAIDAVERGIIQVIIGPLNSSVKLDFELPYLTSSYIDEWQASVRKAYEV